MLLIMRDKTNVTPYIKILLPKPKYLEFVTL